MPRQIHLTITEEQRQACWKIARRCTVPTTWQEIARRAIDTMLDSADMQMQPERTKKGHEP